MFVLLFAEVDLYRVPPFSLDRAFALEDEEVVEQHWVEDGVFGEVADQVLGLFGLRDLVDHPCNYIGT